MVWLKPILLFICCTKTYRHISHTFLYDFYRAMPCKRGLCRHAVSVRLFVRPSVTFVHSIKTNKQIFNFFSPSGSPTILVFPYHGNIPTETALTRAWNAGKVGKNRDFQPVYGFIACCQRCDRQVLSTWRRRTVASCDTCRW